jgi:uncharacterized protein (DUF2062 family)
MIHVTRALIRKWVESLLHIHDSPQRTAAAFAVGVFWGFSPYFGLHTMLGLACAFLFGLNRVAVVVGVYVNLPWVIVPYYTLATWAGAKMLGVGLPADFVARLERVMASSIVTREFWGELVEVMRPLLWPYHVGSLIGAAGLGVLAYAVALPAIRVGRDHMHLRGHAPKPPEST